MPLFLRDPLPWLVVLLLYIYNVILVFSRVGRTIFGNVFNPVLEQSSVLGCPEPNSFWFGAEAVRLLPFLFCPGAEFLVLGFIDSAFFVIAFQKPNLFTVRVTSRFTGNHKSEG